MSVIASIEFCVLLAVVAESWVKGLISWFDSLNPKP